MLISATASATSIKLELADLKSRLVWDQVYHLLPPDDNLKVVILKQKAKARSFDLSDEVIDYLMHHTDRDLNSLIKIINAIDHASLASKRKITIPFLKQLIE